MSWNILNLISPGCQFGWGLNPLYSNKRCYGNKRDNCGQVFLRARASWIGGHSVYRHPIGKWPLAGVWKTLAFFSPEIKRQREDFTFAENYIKYSPKLYSWPLRFVFTQTVLDFSLVSSPFRIFHPSGELKGHGRTQIVIDPRPAITKDVLLWWLPPFLMINIAYRAKYWGKSLGVRRDPRGFYSYNTRQTLSHFMNLASAFVYLFYKYCDWYSVFVALRVSWRMFE